MSLGESFHKVVMNEYAIVGHGPCKFTTSFSLLLGQRFGLVKPKHDRMEHSTLGGSSPTRV